MRRVQTLSPALGLGPTARRVALTALLVLAAAAVMALLGDVEILKKAETLKAGGKGIDGVQGAVDGLKGPATATVASISGLGTLAGGAMMGFGMPQGIKLMGVSGGSLGAVIVANGIIA